jgi:hypothetical protein
VAHRLRQRTIGGLVNFGYLGLMFINIGFPSGITSPREFFNLDWITLAVILRDRGGRRGVLRAGPAGSRCAGGALGSVAREHVVDPLVAAAVR